MKTLFYIALAFFCLSWATGSVILIREKAARKPETPFTKKGKDVCILVMLVAFILILFLKKFIA